MEKQFKKHETLYTILLIVIYVVVNSYLMQNYGYTSIQSAIANTIMTILLIVLVIQLKRVKYYGLTKPKKPKKFLYFIPLIIISLFSIRNGINTDNPTNEIIFYILMEKDNVKTAIIVSSITFGIGHIVNLLNGADFIPTLLQVCYAISIGYMLVMVFYKSKSLIPCIIFHSVFNALSIFNSTESTLLSIIVLIILSLGYGLYIDKIIKE